ncbi:acyltransferase family protein [Aquibacillus saliphilus]|uniref:acyltransferase family protein n=1 Tax=Aquibacillus saliphilus TaxID=1909422 RepID=UPI001CEFBEFE|nr:acyltransferase family protein [Aquibacillus saliphilus]
MQREAFIDNAKFFLIFLVVFGHVIQPMTANSETIGVIYHWIYFFHMPAFIFLGGFFAKGSGNKGYLAKLFKKLIYPYLLFQLIYTGYYFLIGMDGWQTTVFKPHWALWFLLSLFCWHLLLIVFKKMPPLFSVVIAIEIGIIIGYISGIGHTFSLSRTFVFFPFFLMGYWISKEQLLKVKAKSVKVTAIFVMAIVAAGIIVAPTFSTSWLLGSESYASMGYPEIGGFIRLGVYLVAILMAVSIMAWVPTKESFVTKLGQRTLYVYLLHGIFIQFFRQADLFRVNNLLDLIGLIVISFAVVLLLSSKPTLTYTQPLIEGKFSLLKNQFSQNKPRRREVQIDK